MSVRTRQGLLVCGARMIIILATTLWLCESACWGQMIRAQPPLSQPTDSREIATSLPVTNLQAEKTEAKVRVALERIVSLDVEKMPLDEFVAKFSQESGLVLQFDHEALRETSLPSNAPVSFRMSNVTLRYVLDRVLAQHHLDWMIADNILADHRSRHLGRCHHGPRLSCTRFGRVAKLDRRRSASTRLHHFDRSHRRHHHD